jgi:hypothetical protein
VVEQQEELQCRSERAREDRGVRMSATPEMGHLPRRWCGSVGHDASVAHRSAPGFTHRPVEETWPPRARQKRPCCGTSYRALTRLWTPCHKQHDLTVGPVASAVPTRCATRPSRPAFVHAGVRLPGRPTQHSSGGFVVVTQSLAGADLQCPRPSAHYLLAYFTPPADTARLPAPPAAKPQTAFW